MAPGLAVEDRERLDRVRAVDLDRLVVRQHLDAGGGGDLVLEDLVAGEAAARHEAHRARDAVHLEGRLEGRVAAADDGDVEALEQRSVAGASSTRRRGRRAPSRRGSQVTLLRRRWR